jgi:hypothetical protein
MYKWSWAVSSSQSMLFSLSSESKHGLTRPETGGLFRLAVKLMMAKSESDVYVYRLSLCSRPSSFDCTAG